MRITYLDGLIEIINLREPHEIIKKSIAILLEIYFMTMEIEFISVGSATHQGEEKGISFEPNESYYLGEKKDNPDLTIEVILTSGSLQKLEKYKRFQIPEVWLWEDNQLRIYHLEDNTYQEFSHSQLLPELNIGLTSVRDKKSPSSPNPFSHKGRRGVRLNFLVPSPVLGEG